MASTASKTVRPALAIGLLAVALGLAFPASSAWAQDRTIDPTTGVEASADPTLSGDAGAAALSFAAIREASLQRLMVGAEAGDPAAILALARHYLRADAPDWETDLAIAVLQRGVELGLDEAHLMLGDLYRDGIGDLPPDFAKAAEHYEVAAANGDNTARRRYAAMLLATRDPATVDQALALFGDATAAGDVPAAIALADIYAAGVLVPADGQKALALYDLGLPSGALDAISGLADLYRNGAPNLAPDLPKAVVLYHEAATLGDRGAKRTLADMYIRGEGVAADLDKGIALLEELAGIGQASALVDLGDLFATGEYTPADGAKAVEYYEQAAEIGDFASLVRIADLYRNGTAGFPPNLAQAADFYAEAADDGNNDARKALAEILIAGAPDVPADPVRAAELLRAAADEGDAEAAEMLAAMASGIDTPS